MQAILCACLAALLMMPAAGLAESLHEERTNPEITIEAEVGYGGVMTYGRTMPIRIRIANDGADIEGVVAVNIYANELQYNRYEQAITLAHGAVKEILLPVRVGSKQKVYTVELWQDGEKLCATNAEPTQLANPAGILIGVLSPTPKNLSYLNIDIETDEMLRGEYSQIVALNEDNFPDDLELLRSFSVIAVDGFDASLLSAGQQEALDRWLEEGNILIVGGGAQAGVTWPYFGEMTGILPGEIERHADITPALLGWLGVTAAPCGEEVPLARSSGGEALIDADGVPLVWRTDVGSGVVYTAAFELGGRPLTGWPGMHTFWQRLMIKDCYSLYDQIFHGNDFYQYNYKSLAYTAQRVPMENDVDLLSAALTVAAVVILGGAVAYWVLKRGDKRQWLWAILPALALAGTGAVCLMAAHGDGARPTMLSIAVLSQDEAGEGALSASFVAASPERGEQVVSVREGTLRPLGSDNYTYYESPPAEPTELLYRYVADPEPGIGARTYAPWQVLRFQIDDLSAPDGMLTCSAWLDPDGLHGSITNRTGADLEEGVLLCRYGYCSVPALKDGESAEVSLRRAEFADPANPVYEDGCMYESLAGGYSSIYQMVSEFLYKDSPRDANGYYAYDEEKGVMEEIMTNAIDQSYQGADYWQMNSPLCFHYVAFADGLYAPEVSVNGEPVARTASRCVIQARLPLAESEDGSVYRIPGMDVARRCALDDGGRPYLAESSAGDDQDYFLLSENPAFAFDIGMAKDAAIDRMAIYNQDLPTAARMCLYDGVEWVECAPGEPVADPGRFVHDGRIYVQFRAPEGGAHEYYEVGRPTILLEGRAK